MVKQSPEWWSAVLEAVHLLIFPFLYWIVKKFRDKISSTILTKAHEVAVTLIATHQLADDKAVQVRHEENLRNFEGMRREIKESQEHVEQYVDESNDRLLEKINGTYVRSREHEIVQRGVHSRLAGLEDRERDRPPHRAG